MITKLIPLQQWAKSVYGEAAPCPETLRRWAREGRIAAEKHGREYFVPPDAHYRGAANDDTKAAATQRSARRCVPADKVSASILVEQMIHGRKKKAA